MNADEVLEGLDPEQRAVAATPLGPMVVLAGAGTGKTRAITHRIAYGVHSAAYQPQRVLAVTFTARAAGEMRTRLRSLGVPQVQARTFHAAALRQLHYFWPRAIGGAAPEVLPHKAPVVGEAASRLRLQLDRVVMRDLASEIEWSKVSMLTSETYPAAARRAGRSPAELDPTAMARLIELYEEVKTERGVIDFEDVLLLMVGILAEHPEIAREVRAQYRHFVVDEYQDVNTLQQHLLDQWVGERDDLCVVGDPAQTIYSFTGASPRHLLHFGQRHPSAQQVRLVRNYRSTPQVIGLANLVLAGSGRDAVQLQAQRAGGPAPELTAYPDDQAEARGVASELRRLVDTGESPAEMAILFRTNGQSEALEAALTELEVPYLVRGGERFFNRAEVRNAVLLLRAAARSDDGSTPLGDLVRDVITGAGWSVEPPAGGAQRERWESLNALATLADDFAAAGEDVRLPHLVVELDRRAGEQHAPTVQGVTLASLHAAKGLEWDTVFVVGASDGLLPISMATGPQEIEEERRLLYVGITRARRRLGLSFAAARSPGGRATRRPSRFLDGAASVLGEQARSRPKAKPVRERRVARASKCAGCGRDLTTAAERKVGRCADCPPTYDVAQFEALKAWRLAVARATSVPAFVVFTDATLTAIAEKRPASEAQLRQIAGVGTTKLERYGAGVLAVMAGGDPEQEAEKCCAAMGSADD